MAKRKTKISNWETYYIENETTEMPWYNGNLDEDLRRAIIKRNINTGNFLDIGSGPGTQALELHKLGFIVTGSDISKTAMKKASRLSPHVEFITDDIVNTKIKKSFDFIFDRGCFHTIAEPDRIKYLASIRKLLNQNGILFLKCFSTKEPGIDGPYRISHEIIKEVFQNDFKIEEIQDTAFFGQRVSAPKAIFCVLKLK